MEAARFRFSHSRHVALCFCSPPKRREFFRPESLQFASCKSFLRRLCTYQACPDYTSRACSDSRRDLLACVETERRRFVFWKRILEIGVLGIETSLPVNLKSSSLVSVEKPNRKKSRTYFALIPSIQIIFIILKKRLHYDIMIMSKKSSSLKIKLSFSCYANNLSETQ